MHRKEVADRLADLVGQSPNIFGKLDSARRKDWLKISKKKWNVGDGKVISVNR